MASLVTLSFYYDIEDFRCLGLMKICCENINPMTRIILNILYILPRIESIEFRFSVIGLLAVAVSKAFFDNFCYINVQNHFEHFGFLQFCSVSLMFTILTRDSSAAAQISHASVIAFEILSIIQLFSGN